MGFSPRAISFLPRIVVLVRLAIPTVNGGIAPLATLGLRPLSLGLDAGLRHRHSEVHLIRLWACGKLGKGLLLECCIDCGPYQKSSWVRLCQGRKVGPATRDEDGPRSVRASAKQRSLVEASKGPEGGSRRQTRLPTVREMRKGGRSEKTEPGRFAEGPRHPG